jgi:hypothetical protein
MSDDIPYHVIRWSVAFLFRGNLMDITTSVF